MINLTKIILLASLCLGLTACAASQAPMVIQNPDPTPTPPQNTKQTLLAEVQTLEDLLSTSYREDFGVEVNNLPAAGAVNDGIVSACKDICGLYEAICLSSSKICNISEQYPQEADFSERCTWSTQHCESSKLTCERCNP